jgi:hypothetical protein
MKTFLTVTGLILGLIAVLFAIPLLVPHDKDGSAEPSHGLPWQVDALYGGKSRVFNLILGESTLEDAKAKLGSDLQLALIAAPEETGTVEAYFDRLNTGFVTGKMIITADLTPETIAQIKARSPKREYMESSTRKYALTPEDAQLVMQSKIRALSFIPSINLDAGMVEQRFGSPAERLKVGTVEHMLYPEKGLDVVLDPEGKEILQYVAPGTFAQLKDPLLAKK